MRTTGTVTASVTDRTDSGGVSACVVRVEHGPLTTTVTRLAPARNLLPSEVPQPGDTVVVFRLPGERTVVQAVRDRTRRVADVAASSPTPVAATASPAYGTPPLGATTPHRDTPAPSAAAGRSPSGTTDDPERSGGLAAELQQLADLHTAGSLTAEEFAAAKRRLLGLS